MTDHELVAAVLAGEAGAVAAFDGQFVAELRRIVLRLGVRDDVEDVVQRLRVRILVGTADAPAKLAQWRGEGSLQAWVRAVATRFVIDHRRHVQARGTFDALGDRDPSVAPVASVALRHDRYREIVRAALEAAFEALDPRARNLLRYATFEGLGVDALGRMYGVHRATAGRWLQRTRDRLHADVAERVRSATGMSADDARSVVREIGGGIDVSLRSVLSIAVESDAWPQP